jgi:hypothetical protein
MASWQQLRSGPRISVCSSAVSCRWHSVSDLTWRQGESACCMHNTVIWKPHVWGYEMQQCTHQHCCGESAKVWWNHMDCFTNSLRPWMITIAGQFFSHKLLNYYSVSATKCPVWDDLCVAVYWSQYRAKRYMESQYKCSLQLLTYILDSNLHHFYSFRGLKIICKL